MLDILLLNIKILTLKTEYFSKNKNNEKKKKNFKNSKNSLNKLSLFQKNDGRFSRKCPFSVKNAPVIDYKNISLTSKIYYRNQQNYYFKNKQCFFR